MTGKTALIMAGGTGGHIFPGLALAQALRAQGWRVHWLGAQQSMESQIIPPHGFVFESIAFSGVRGKGWRKWLFLPLHLARAMWQSRQVLQRVKPNVVVGFGGYISFPAGVMAALLGCPLVLHEQNSVAGMANKGLAKIARSVFSAFPHVLKNAQWVGNPLRSEFLNRPEPAARFAGRSGVLKMVVVGGSLGAQALNQIVPQALALIPLSQRPQVVHQSGVKQIEALRNHYAEAGVSAELTPFIDNTAQAFADADVIVCRAGASTVTEIAAIGAAAIFVPFPFAVDDHQTQNAQFLVQNGAGWLLPQAQLTAPELANLLQTLSRDTLLKHAQQAKNMQKIQAIASMLAACEELAT